MRSYLIALFNVMSRVLKLDVLVGILFAVITRFEWVVTVYFFPILAAAVAPAVRILICLPTCATTIAAVIITATVVVAHVANAIPHPELTHTDSLARAHAVTEVFHARGRNSGAVFATHTLLFNPLKRRGIRGDQLGARTGFDDAVFDVLGARQRLWEATRPRVLEPHGGRPRHQHPEILKTHFHHGMHRVCGHSPRGGVQVPPRFHQVVVCAADPAP